DGIRDFSRDWSSDVCSSDLSTVTDRVVLSTQGLEVRAVAGRPLISDVSFDIHAGEILGIAGVEGNGQTELIEAIIGVQELDQGQDRKGVGEGKGGEPRVSRS